MAQSKMTDEELEQQQLFGSLFGFKSGDRIKMRVKAYSFWSTTTPRYYWRYGRVIEVIKREKWDTEDRVRVKFSGDYYSSTMPTSRLVRCRKYVRKRK